MYPLFIHMGRRGTLYSSTWRQAGLSVGNSPATSKSNPAVNYPLGWILQNNLLLKKNNTAMILVAAGIILVYYLKTTTYISSG